MKKYWFVIFLVVLVILFGGYWYYLAHQPQYQPQPVSPHLEGNLDSPVSLLEYSDFQCPACGQAYKLIKQLLEQNGDKFKLEYRHYPLVSIHPFAFRAAAASECAADQGKFWEYHDLLFSNQENLTRGDLLKYAGQVVGLDTAKFQWCLDSGAMEDRVKASITDGANQGFNSTPTFILNGQKIADWSQLPQIITELNKAIAQPANK